MFIILNDKKGSVIYSKSKRRLTCIVLLLYPAHSLFNLLHGYIISGSLNTHQTVASLNECEKWSPKHLFSVR